LRARVSRVFAFSRLWPRQKARKTAAFAVLLPTACAL
jgi:hypothetical protein